MPWCLNKTFRILIFLFCCVGLSILSKEALAQETKTFDGRIDFFSQYASFIFDLKEQGMLSAAGNTQGDNYSLHVSLKHVRFGKSDISCDFYSSGIIIKAGSGKIKAVKGKAWTQASLLNFKPLKEFSADYEINDSGLTIKALSWADIEIKGDIKRNPDGTLFSNPDFDLSLTIKEMALDELAGLLGINPKDTALSGKVSGEIRLKGPKEAIKIEAKLTALDGGAGEVKFNSAKFTLGGIFPVMRLEDAQINEVNGAAYELKGQFNLLELSNLGSPQHQVTVHSANNIMLIQDWIIKHNIDYEGKDIVEAAYPLKNNQALKMRIKNQDETLGWQKTVKF